MTGTDLEYYGGWGGAEYHRPTLGRKKAMLEEYKPGCAAPALEKRPADVPFATGGSPM